ncbi:MAG: FtsQ-type POTRA domain-containing protein [Faecousia sp.]
MDTTQESRETAGKRRPQTSGQKDASQRTGNSAPEQRPRRGGQSPQERPRRTAEQGAQERPRRTAEQNAQERPRRSAEQTPERLQRPRQNAQERPARQVKSGQQRKSAAQTQQKKGAEKSASQRTKPASAPRQTAPRRTPADDDVPNRKRAYGNSKPKKKSPLSVLSEALQNTKQKRASRTPQRNTSRQTERKRQTTPTPAVIYTQPLPFNRDRLIVQLLTVTAVVLAIVMGLSVFFKVETITVTGADTYSAWAIREASGISEGDNLLTFSKIRAASQIMANLPYVKGVRIGIKLPDTVNIMIEEESVVYAIKSGDGLWWLMDSDGRMVEQANNAKASGCTQVLGVTLDNPAAGEKGIATEMIPTETNELGELIPVTTTGAQRLTAALQILKALEDNDIVGDAASVDVTRTENIILWYGSRYQVNLGDSTRLDYKIACMNDAILQMSEYQSGILDISFTIWPNQVGYTPFD